MFIILNEQVSGTVTLCNMRLFLIVLINVYRCSIEILRDLKMIIWLIFIPMQCNKIQYRLNYGNINSQTSIFLIEALLEPVQV